MAFEDRVEGHAARCTDALVAAGVVDPAHFDLVSASYVFFLDLVIEEARCEQRSGMVGQTAWPNAFTTCEPQSALSPS